MSSFLHECLWKSGKEVQILTEVVLRRIATLIYTYKKVWFATGEICFSDFSERWHRLPREIVESPFLEILKTHLDTTQCSLL